MAVAVVGCRVPVLARPLTSRTLSWYDTCNLTDNATRSDINDGGGIFFISIEKIQEAHGRCVSWRGLPSLPVCLMHRLTRISMGL